LLKVWHEHLTIYDDRPIEHAEIEHFVEHVQKIRADMITYVYREDSLLSRLGYAAKVVPWEAELAGPWELLTNVLYPYRNALRRVDLTSLRDNPAKAMEFEDRAYLRSKEIRMLFAEYRKRVSAQLTTIRDLLEHGN
jgi:hypothetical protein